MKIITMIYPTIYPNGKNGVYVYFSPPSINVDVYTDAYVQRFSDLASKPVQKILDNIHVFHVTRLIDW